MDIRAFDRIDESLLRHLGRLRVEAWKTETCRAAEMSEWIDEFDEDARHWVVFQNEAPVAAARMTIHERLADIPDAETYADVFPEPPAGPIASFNRMVVHPCARGAGVSKSLDLIRLATAENLGCRSALLSTASGDHRVRQLLGWGFELAGYGSRFEKPPLCYLPAPAVLLCRLPRVPCEGKAAIEAPTG